MLSALFAAILLVFGLVGALVASRLPANPIGWLFLALALIEGVYELAFGYTHYALDRARALPGAAWAAWVANWTSPLSPPFLIARAAAVPRRPTADAALALGAVAVRAARRAGRLRARTRSRRGRSTSSRR